MDINQVFSLMMMIAGVIFIYFRLQLASKAVNFYSKFGMNVSVELYAKQFVFIGIMMIVVSFLSITGLINFL